MERGLGMRSTRSRAALGIDPRLITMALAVAFAPAARASDGRPNVLIVITDDQGYGDLSCHGNPALKTPNLDRLYGESVRLTNFHVDPTCAPTRAALMTGRYSGRVGVWHTVMGRQILRTSEVTMPEILSRAGYATGIFGKWHLGDNYPYRAHERGFRESLVHGGGGVAQVPDAWGNDYFDDTYMRNGTPEVTAGYCTDVWFQNAREFVKAHKDGPFFAYVATNAPHSPYLVPERYAEPYEGRADVANPEFLGMIACIDENVGRLLQTLRDEGLERDTIVVYMTDNGSAAGYDPATGKGFNAGMRGMKGSPFDGGHRVPCFVRWPGGGIGGGKDVSRLTAHLDLLPTLLDLCGVPLPDDLRPDGRSLAPLLRDPKSAWMDRAIVVESQRLEEPEKWRQCAVMTESHRLVNGKELYDMIADPGQTRDVSSASPEVVERLRESYEAWWASVSEGHRGVARVPLGVEGVGTVRLTAHDWHGPRPLAYQQDVRDGVVGNGYWAVEVAVAGPYDIEFRRWPREDPRPINDGPGPRAETAEVDVAGVQGERKVGADDESCVFRLELAAGPAELKTRFAGPEGARGAYFVYVTPAPGAP